MKKKRRREEEEDRETERQIIEFGNHFFIKI